MYICVRLFTAITKPLWYKIPNGYETQQSWIHKVVRVPLRGRTVPALIVAQQQEYPLEKPCIIHSIDAVLPFPDDLLYQAFLKQLQYTYQIPDWILSRRLIQFLHEKKRIAQPQCSSRQYSSQQAPLTNEQQRVVDYLQEPIIKGMHTPVVLHGVTGSGKTHVYKDLIIHTIAQNKTILFLLPEVTLSISFEQRFKTLLGNGYTIYGFHSATSAVTKKQLWADLLSEKPILIIGVHLPILLPIANLGLIIIDEEHEQGYTEKKHPKINSKQAAIARAQLYSIPILLGSATPSIATLHRVKTQQWKFFQLKKRFSGSLPTIQKINLITSKKRTHFWISAELHNAVADRLAKKEQILIFINRRGFCFFVQCSHCSFIFSCSSCSVSLTLHDNNRLMCHYCGNTCTLASSCPDCKAESDAFIKKGIGTQQVVSLLKSLFPQARIERADVDTTSKKEQWNKTLLEFESGTIDILVGTQTIAKGYHFPGVTLVGVLWADSNLHFPAYNATEGCLQQLIQVAGRAGRASHNGLVIIQTLSDHAIFEYSNEVDYLQLYKKEIAARTTLNYPPCSNFIVIELRNTCLQTIAYEADQFTHHLHEALQKYNSAITILGPSLPPVHTINNVHTRIIHLKGQSFDDIVTLYTDAHTAMRYTSHIFFTPH